jgi:hypothetical protein
VTRGLLLWPSFHQIDLHQMTVRRATFKLLRAVLRAPAIVSPAAILSAGRVTGNPEVSLERVTGSEKSLLVRLALCANPQTLQPDRTLGTGKTLQPDGTLATAKSLLPDETLGTRKALQPDETLGTGKSRQPNTTVGAGEFHEVDDTLGKNGDQQANDGKK